MRATSIRVGLLAATLVLLHSDAALGDAASCFNQGPPQPTVSGDELFFSNTSAPPNVMVMLDTSGSMQHLAQCDGLATSGTGGNGSPTVNWGEPGCNPGLSNNTGGCSVSWMDTFATSSTSIEPFDPGDSSASPYLTDAPTWRTGCTTTNCGLFKPAKYYRYGEWNTSSAYERTLGTSNNQACDTSVVAGTTCNNCLTTKGYYVYNKGGTQGAVFSGSWLNKNPPKYVVARKVIKDLVKMTASDAALDGVRFGLSVFDGGNGATVVVPLGPSCDNSVGATGIDKTLYKPVRQKLFDAVNSSTLVAFAGATPLADSLYDLGQYFSGGSWNGRGSMTTRGSSPTLRDTDPGSANASWASSNKSICWRCQKSAIVMVTDGAPKGDNNNLPTPDTTNTFPDTSDADFSTATVAAPHCGSGSATQLTRCGTDDSPPEISRLPLVAKFLKNTDLRDYPNTNADGTTNVGQTVTTYTISFGIPSTNTRAINILQTTADLGGGQFFNTSSGAALSLALNAAATATAQEANSFSASRASSLQTNTGGASLGETFLARFQPGDGKQVFWQGHLLQARLFDEFASGCDPTLPQANQLTVSCGTKTVSVNLNGDTTGSPAKAVCNGVFLVDKNCDPIFEDPTSGQLKKGQFDSTGAVVAATGGAVGNAVFFWDAAQTLATQASDPPGATDTPSSNPTGRFIYTVIDTNADGKLTSADGLTPFTPGNAAALAKYMDLSPTWCTDLYTRLALSPIPTTWTAADIAYCAEQVIWFVRGMDVLDFDKDGCAGPANAPSPGAGKPVSTRPNVVKDAITGKGCDDVTKGEERNLANDNSGLGQFGKLGDIFHSIPVAVKPPIAPFVCDLNGENQCLGTIHGMKTASSTVATPQADYSSKTAYEAYRADNVDRDRIVLAGANDGMIHAFHAGIAQGSTRDVFGNLPYNEGTGKEIWAFIPPDLLPRIKDSLLRHTYYVDGSPMARDVWYDANQDGVKQKTEFHTVAIVGERGGGIAYTALDVTDPYSPQFLWSFPPPRSAERLLAGQSWSDFGGRPPPIGPVRLKISGSTPADPANRTWEERWIVMLGGGFDPTLVKGRRVWMVDAYTGTLLWRFSDEDFQADIRASGKTSSLFPVAAAPGLLDVGTTDGNGGVLDSDGFFDTATWGDLGGNLWVARFYAPGEIDTGTKRVNNWWAARSFEQQRAASTQPAAGRTEFFQMTGNTITTDDQRVHTFLGGGNRARLLESGAHCSADDLMGCCRASCTTVGTSLSQDFGAGQCTVSAGNTSTALCSTTNGIVLPQPTTTGTCGDSGTCSGFDATTNVRLQCGSNAVGTPSAVTTCVENATLGISTCTAEAAAPTSTQALSGTAARTRFYAVWSYGGDTTKRFANQTEAAAFDTQRFTDVTFAGCSATSNSCALTNVTSGSTAASDGPGWFFQHGDVCPLQSCSPAAPWEDEKTATAGIPDTLGCVSWRTIRPTSSAGDPCTRSFGSPVTLTYMSDYTFGNVTSNCSIRGSNGNTYRAIQRNSVSPPTERVSRVSVNARGEVQNSTMTIDQGQPQVHGSQTRRSLLEPTFWLELDRDLHTCRHSDGSTCD